MQRPATGGATPSFFNCEFNLYVAIPFMPDSSLPQFTNDYPGDIKDKALLLHRKAFHLSG
jgi:hypothetical protein